MLRSNIYSIQLPYLGAKVLEESSSSALFSLQQPLRDLTLNIDQHLVDHRILITEDDLLILDNENTLKEKRNIIFSNLDGIVDVQTLKLSLKKSSTDTDEEQPVQGAFLPIGSEDQDRFRSIYSPIGPHENQHLTSPAAQCPLVLLIFRRADLNSSKAATYDCHVFSVHRESLAFELCDLLRKFIAKRNTAVQSSPQRIFSPLDEHSNDPPIRYFERPRPVPIMAYPPSLLDEEEQHNNHCQLNVNIDDLVHTKTNLSSNPCSFASFLLDPVQHSTSPSHHTSQVLTNTRHSDMSSSPSKQQQRNFIKSSSATKDESEEVVDDLMNIVAMEKLKTQGVNKRQASYDAAAANHDYPINKKRQFHHRKRSFQRMASMDHLDQVHSLVESPILRPSVMANRYGDIGNYVPKLLRDNVTMRSSDSNENIFFRSSHGHLLNGFLHLDVSGSKSPKEKCHYEQETVSLIQPLRTNSSRKSYPREYPRTLVSSSPIYTTDMAGVSDEYRILRTPKSRLEKREGTRMVSYAPSSHYGRMDSSKVQMVISKPKRAHSLNILHTEVPMNYRRYLRPTGHAAYLYADQVYSTPPTLECSLGYFP